MTQKSPITELRSTEGRGKLLTILIMFNGMLHAIGLTSDWKRSLLNLLGCILLIYIWKWKKISAYCYIIFFAAFFILSSAIKLASLNVGGVFIPLALLSKPDILTSIVWGPILLLSFEWILWIWAIYRKRHLFT